MIAGKKKHGNTTFRLCLHRNFQNLMIIKWAVAYFSFPTMKKVRFRVRIMDFNPYKMNYNFFVVRATLLSPGLS